MTEAVGKQITQLRLKGLGYKSIGIVVGTSRENVRYFCKTHNRFDNSVRRYLSPGIKHFSVRENQYG